MYDAKELKSTLLEVGGASKPESLGTAGEMTIVVEDSETKVEAPPVLSQDTEEQLQKKTEEVTRTVKQYEGRYYMLPYVDKESDCLAMGWAWGFRWGYAALHVGPTSPFDEMTFTTDYEVIKRDPDALWVTCVYLSGEGPYTGPKEHELRPDFEPEGKRKEGIDKCRKERGEGPVQLCILPAVVFTVYEYVFVAICIMVWFAAFRNRRRVVSPNVSDCAIGGGRCVGNDPTEEIEHFGNIGFCNCVTNSFLCCCAMAKGGMMEGLRGFLTGIECCLCFPCVWAETVAKSALTSAPLAYGFAVAFCLAMPGVMYCVVWIPYYLGYLIPLLMWVVFIIMRCVARPKIRGDEEMTAWDFVAHGITACGSCFYCWCAVFQEAEFLELRGDKLLDSLDGVQRDVERKHSVERQTSAAKQPDDKKSPDEDYDLEGEEVYQKEDW